MKKKRFLNKESKLFTRIIFIYSIITVVSLSCLSGFTIAVLRKDAKDSALENNSKVLSNVQNIVENKYIVTQNLLQQLYMNQNFSSSVFSFLDMDRVDFFLYSLNYYMDTNISLKNYMDQYFTLCFMQDKDIESIMLLSYEKDFLYVCTNFMGIRYYLSDSEEYQHLIKEIDGYPVTNGMILTHSLDPLEDNDFLYSSVIDIKAPTSYKTIGKLIVNFDTQSLYNTIAENSSGLDQSILILNRENSIIFDSSQTYYQEKKPLFPAPLEDDFYYNNVENPNYDLTYLGLIPIDNVEMSLSTSFILLANLICCIGIISMSYAIISSYSKRIAMVTSAIQKVQTGDLNVTIPIYKKKDEITKISQNFNKMCGDLKNYINKVYLSQVKQKNAELKALQAQINPHFLYNTLEAIRMRAIVKGATDVSDMIYILATFFKNSIKSETMTTIEKEIEHCELYLNLFKIRYGDILHIDMDIDPEIKQYLIIKLSLQPIMENYIIHGIRLDGDDNRITITGNLKDDRIIITVNDNGYGIPTDKLEQLQASLKGHTEYKSKGIGLSNVNERLKIVYGHHYGLKLESQLEQGTCVTLIIPAQKKEDK